MPRSKLEFEQVDDVEFASQTELDTVKDNNADPSTFVAATMNNYALWQRLGGDITNGRVFTIEAGRVGRTTNIYINVSGVATNRSPVVIPFACQIVAMSASSEGSFTWTAEVYKNAVATPVATLAISSAASGYSTSYSSVNFAAGDLLKVRCAGSSIEYPRVHIFMQRGTEGV
jgi:hypothetical protein